MTETPLTNLLDDPWISVRRRSDARCEIRPWEVTDGHEEDPIVDIVAPRPDFRSALYQFLVGLLQTTMMPEDDDSWLDAWEEPPQPEALRKKIEPFREAFMVAGDGPLFLQDRSAAGSRPVPIGALLIDEPGEATVKENRDHFVKQNRIAGLSQRAAIHALITMQCMAPSGGAGNRTGLRGGGPLTTLLIPAEEQRDSLWRRLWLNVLDRDGWSLVPGGQGSPEIDAAIFPWLGPTRTSEKGGVETTPEDAHSLQLFWSMPRRILLGATSESPTPCSLSGARRAMTHFSSRPWGPNYEGPWRHPLSPHYRKEDDLLPVHPQPGGFTYQLWASWAQPPLEDNAGALCADVVARHLLSPRRAKVPVRLWASGYDMENMKARCFYEQTWPLFYFPAETTERARAVAESLASLASLVASVTRSRIREAWLRRPKDHSDAKNNISFGVLSHIYTASEAAFFGHLSCLHNLCNGDSDQLVDGEAWRRELAKLSLETFDHYVAIESLVVGDAGRIARARNGLQKVHWGKKADGYVADITNAIDAIVAQRGER